MTEEQKSALKAAGKAAIARVLKANNNTAWASGESAVVIEELYTAAESLEVPFSAPELRENVRKMCNASAFFSELTKLAKDHPFYIEHTPRVRGSRAMGLLE